MIDTATISIERFKELESAEETLKSILRDPDKFVVRSSYGYQFWAVQPNSENSEILMELDAVIRDRDSAYARLRELEAKITEITTKKRWL